MRSQTAKSTLLPWGSGGWLGYVSGWQLCPCYTEFWLYGHEVYAYILLLLVAHVTDPGAVGTIGRAVLLSFDHWCLSSQVAWHGNLIWSAVPGVHRMLFGCRYCCLNCCVGRIIACNASIRKSTLTQTPAAPRKEQSLLVLYFLPESPFSWKISLKTLSHCGARTVISHGHEASSWRRKSWCKSSVQVGPDYLPLSFVGLFSLN